MSNKIKINFHPFGFDKRTHAVTKSENGKERRYLIGVSSGTKVDGMGERMTKECIKDFQAQAESGDILLYPDVHGIRGTDDIGILTKAEILPDDDWQTTYRLYDEQDGVDKASVEKANKLWKQVNGLPPYKKPQQRGFSIEGIIPEPDGIIKVDSTGKRVINKIILDGVVVVPRPAYTDSVAHAVYKALGENPPWKVRKGLKETLDAKLQDAQDRSDYYEKKYLTQDALWTQVELIMRSESSDKESELKVLFDEFSSLMIGLIIEYQSAFNEEANNGLAVMRDKKFLQEIRKEILLKQLVTKANNLKNILKKGR